MADILIVKSKIKEVAQGCNVAGDFAKSLDKVAREMIKEATKRAKANNRKTVQAKDAFAGEFKPNKNMLVSKSKVKESVNSKFNVSGDFAQALNECVVWCVEQASLRAQANGRKTITPKDL